MLERLVRAQAERKPTMLRAPHERQATAAQRALASRHTGLHFGVTYAVFGVDEDGRRVKLYNPWGHDHPGGDGWLDVDDAAAFFELLEING